MKHTDENSKGDVYSGDMVSGIRIRTGLMVLASSGAVALAFGVSFYFALVSGQTAVTGQFPELAPIVTKLKSLLVVNTAGFMAIVIASFWLLSRLITTRMFRPLGTVMAGLRKAVEDRYPESREPDGTGPFGEFETSWTSAVTEIRARESREIGILEESVQFVSDTDSRDSIEKMIEEKKRRILSDASNAAAQASGEGTGDELFMQPV